MFAVYGTHAILHTHAINDRVVDVQAFGANVHDLAGFEAAIGTGDSVKHTGQFSFHIRVSTIA